MPVFERKEFMLRTGVYARYTIDCDAFDEEEMETLAWLISEKGTFREVHAASRGARRLAATLEKYRSEDGVRLIVDDVLTTGQSMTEAREQTGWHDAVGVVIFSRGPCPDWVMPIFAMTWIDVEDDSRGPRRDA